MKKFFAIILIAMLSLSLVACGGDSSTPTNATIAPTIAPTVATQKPTQPATTAKPTQATTAKPTEPSTFASSEIVDTAPATNPSEPSSSDVETTMNENGEKVMSGTVTGLGGLTVVIQLANGQEYEFAYSGAEITNSENFATGSSVTITYTGDIMGDSLGLATSIVVG